MIKNLLKLFKSKEDLIKVEIKYDYNNTKKYTNSIIGAFIKSKVVKMGYYSEIHHEGTMHGYLFEICRLDYVDFLRVCRKYRLKVILHDSIICK